jgi:hypothetical protein
MTRFQDLHEDIFYEILAHLSLCEWRKIEDANIFPNFRTCRVPKRIIAKKFEDIRRRRTAIWYWEGLRTYIYVKIYARRRRQRTLARFLTID